MPEGDAPYFQDKPFVAVWLSEIASAPDPALWFGPGETPTDYDWRLAEAAAAGMDAFLDAEDAAAGRPPAPRSQRGGGT